VVLVNVHVRAYVESKPSKKALYGLAGDRIVARARHRGMARMYRADKPSRPFQVARGATSWFSFFPSRVRADLNSYLHCTADSTLQEPCTVQLIREFSHLNGKFLNFRLLLASLKISIYFMVFLGYVILDGLTEVHDTPVGLARLK
jgi:hypothetical protein